MTSLREATRLHINHHPNRWPFILYILTGFTGLLIEQGFERYLTLLVGATTSASAVVIFTYFLGFALGSILTSKLLACGWIRRPLIAYGVLEFLVGLSGVGFTFVFHPGMELLGPWQGAFVSPGLRLGVRFLFGCVFILPTAAMMGASFPLITHVVDRQAVSAGCLWTRAYAMNLAGAAAAALLGPHAILPLLGVRGAFWLCFAICAFVLAAAYRQRSIDMGPAAAGFPGPSARSGSAPTRDLWLLLAASFLSGAVFFALEVLWTHLIGAVLGTSIYAFASMLLAVLVGLLIGAIRAGRRQATGQPIAYDQLLMQCTLALAIQCVLWGAAPGFFAFTPPRVFQNFYGVEFYKLAIAALLIIPPATLLGTIFPSLLAHPVLTGGDRTHWIGYMNAANSVGCLSGVVLGLFWLIPALGSEGGLKAVVLAVLAMGLAFAWRYRRSRQVLAGWAALGAVVLALLLGWRWNRLLLTAGLNVRFGTTVEAARVASAGAGGPRLSNVRMIFFHEDAQGGITSVLEQVFRRGPETKYIRTLLTNGKFQGNDDPEGEMEAQIGFSTIPSFFVPRFGRALVIGLGTGHSAAALTELGYREVVLAELAAGIVEAADRCFRHLNYGVVSHPHSKLFVEDGRNLLLADRHTRYDLVTIEVSSIWFAGATNIYSREFYELVRGRLAPGGVLQQWVQLHHVGTRELACEVATARDVFPYVSYWQFGAQGMLVASLSPQRLDPARLADIATRFAGSGRRSEPASRHLVERMRRSELLSPRAVDRMIAATQPPINTDHNRWLEYSTPKYQHSRRDWRSANLGFLSTFGDGHGPAAR